MSANAPLPTKVCATCNQRKSTALFGREAKAKSGLKASCMACVRIAQAKSARKAGRI